MYIWVNATCCCSLLCAHVRSVIRYQLVDDLLKRLKHVADIYLN